jgi:hypothetical protein
MKTENMEYGKIDGGVVKRMPEGIYEKTQRHFGAFGHRRDLIKVEGGEVLILLFPNLNY